MNITLIDILITLRKIILSPISIFLIILFITKFVIIKNIHNEKIKNILNITWIIVIILFLFITFEKNIIKLVDSIINLIIERI